MKHFQDEDPVPYDSSPIGGIHTEEDQYEDHSMMWREEDSRLQDYEGIKHFQDE